jgi:hypothetical protein
MRRHKSIQLLALAALIFSAGLATGAESGRGIVSGIVRLVGSPPDVSAIKSRMNSEWDGRKAQPLLLGTNQAVREAIVYLAGLMVNSANHETNNVVILDQRDGRFIPHIQIARSGAQLILRNSDPILHVVRIDAISSTNSSRTLLKTATPYAGYEKKYQLANFREPTLLQVTSVNGQQERAAYIAVMPHPWAALTDDNGRFALRDVPAGKHQIYAWHEVLGTLVREVQINGGRTATVDFQFTSGR